MLRNYFADLELTIDARPEEIRQAYRRLARRFHPDLNPMDPQAEESFKRIREAFDYLSEGNRAEVLREKLERSVVRNMKPTKWALARQVPESPSKFIKEWVEEKSITRTKTKTKRKEVLDLQTSVGVSPQEWKTGFRRRLSVMIDLPCGSCRSVGKRAGAVRETCKKCSGLGHYLISRGALNWKKTCDDCRGRGAIHRTSCSACRGRGKSSQKEDLVVSIPGGVSLSQPLIIKNFGHYSFDGKKRGDLWVNLQVEE